MRVCAHKGGGGESKSHVSESASVRADHRVHALLLVNWDGSASCRPC